MKYRSYFFCAMVLVTGTTASAAPRHFSDVTCGVATDAGKCSLEWDFSATPRMRYTVERLNPDTGSWNVVHVNNAMHLTARKRVAAGNLYRVQGCNGSSRKRADDCVSSRVIWAPIHLPVKAIPAEVVDSSGQVMAIDKNADHDFQLEQYNVYMLVRLIGGRAIDLADLPPMQAVSEEDVWRDGRWSPETALRRSIYLNYSGMQEVAMARAAPKPAASR